MFCFLKKAIEESGISKADIAAALGMKESAFIQKLNNQDLGIVDAEILIELLEIKNPIQVFFGNK